MYSPRIPNENIITPKQNSISIIIDVYPSTSIVPANFKQIITIDAINAASDDRIPITEMNLIGKLNL